MTSRTEAAPVPELAGMPGLDPRWSRRVEADDADGVRRSWHVLDNGVEPVHGTMLCVHGNPTWSYLWRRFLAEAPAGWRVVAVDQLGMGWSERTPARTLAQRVDDLGSLTDALGITGPVVTVAHDWGGPVSLGWALAHRAQLRAVVLTNTAVHQPAGAAAPSLIRLARTPGLRQALCVASPAFVRTTSALSWPPLPAAVRDALAAPYATPARRRAVGDFVADIPLDPVHPSAAPLDRIADGLGALADVPVLMLWGPRDPVFSDLYLRDLLGRLPHAQVHRYEGASHLVTEDAPRAAGDVWAWVADLEGSATVRDQPEAGGGAPLWAGLTARAGDATPAVVELGQHSRSISFALLDRRVRDLAAGLAATGVRPGDRVALLVPPGADLTAAVYACWRAGAVIVVADAGLGLRAMGRALRGAGPDHVIGIGKALAAARAMRVPGRRIAAGPLDAATRRALGARHGLADLARLGRDHDLPAPPPDDAECAIVFTSGATGPAKGVVYRHRQVQAQLRGAALDLRPHRRRPARRRLRAVRPLRPRARPRLGGARHGRHRSGHADGDRAGRRRRGRPGDRRVRLAGGPAQRRGHRGRPDAGAPRRPGRCAAADVGRRSGPGVAAAGGPGPDAAGGPAHAVRHDRGPARGRHLARRSWRPRAAATASAWAGPSAASRWRSARWPPTAPARATR